jgi:mannan endo-1,4-beta-mannosidase
MRFSLRVGAALVAFASSAFAQTFTLEAEDGTLTGTTTLTEVAGFSGTGYVGGWDADGDSLSLTFTSDATKLYDVKIRYSGPYGSKYTRISYNGVTGGDISLPETTEWATVNAGQALLNAGSNTIKLDNNWGW